MTPTQATTFETQRQRYGFALADCPRRDVGTSLVQPHTNHYSGWALTQTSGRTLRLANLYQYGTYSGQLCGLPSAQDHHLARAVEAAREQFGARTPSGNTPACERHIAILPPDLLAGQFVQQGPDGTEQTRPWLGLPGITSIALFDSDELAPNAPDAYSSAIVVWWQEGYGTPDARALAQLAAMPWQHYAWGWMW